jgi:hypothetical protein
MPVLTISKAHNFSFQLLILLRSTLKSLSLVASTRHVSFNLACCLRLANRPSTQFRNFAKQERPSSFGDRYCLPFKSRKVLVARVLVGRFKSKKRRSTFFPTKTREKTTRDKLRTRTKFQWFLNKTPRSPFKRLIVSTPGLLRGLHTMSLAKSVPEGLNPRECKKTKLREPLPVPYIPEKDKVQEEVVNL